MEERNQLVLEAASMLERIHGVTNSTSARKMAQEGLVRRIRGVIRSSHKKYDEKCQELEKVLINRITDFL